ncbi:cadherin-like domain-containing protein, partial [Psychrobacter celer]|uniref:cadherin-like domain-containing protein n=1 Tax=Psychrobacter celer TaxID=306572 RepID=UPI002FE440F6
VDGNLLGNASETDADITLNVNNVQVDINGDGTPDEITVGTPVDIVDADGNPVGSLTVSPDGSYTFTPDGDFTGDVPEMSYDVVDADSRDVLDSSKLEITVNAVAVVVNLGVTKAEAIETTDNSDTLEFAVTQAFKSDKDTTVKVQLDKVGSAGITASDIASITYTDATGEVTLTDPSAIESFLTSGVDVVIAAGSKEVPVVFEIADDSVYEGQETLTLNISDARNDNGASIGDNAQSGTINDESNNPDNPLDGSNTEGDKPTVSITATDDTAIEGEDSVLEYTVSLGQDQTSNEDTIVVVKVDLASTQVGAADIESISYTNAAGQVATIKGQAAIQAVLDGDNTLEVKVPAGS